MFGFALILAYDNFLWCQYHIIMQSELLLIACEVLDIFYYTFWSKLPPSSRTKNVSPLLGHLTWFMGLQFASISHSICLIKKPSPYPQDLLDKKKLSPYKKKKKLKERGSVTFQFYFLFLNFLVKYLCFYYKNKINNSVFIYEAISQ